MYCGKGVAEGYKSLAISLTYRIPGVHLKKMKLQQP
ncbi:hypothetical protein ACNKHW_09345 [Shigella flexneri]